MSDRSNLEEELYGLMKEYEYPITSEVKGGRTINRDFEPVFVEYEPLDHDYELIEREFLRLELDELLDDWRKVVYFSEETGSYEWFLWDEIVEKNRAFINSVIPIIENQFIQKALDLSKHKYQAAVVMACKDPLMSSHVNQANKWRTEYKEVDRKIYLHSPTGNSYIVLRFTTQGEVFFYKRREDA